MKNRLTRLQNIRGTSFLEVMIALFIMGVITTAIFNVYLTQQKSYMTQDDITTIQQNGRASIDELSRQIRMAGHALPLGIKAIEAANTNPDTITITYREDGCETYLSDPMPQPSAELKCGSDISCFNDGQWVFIFEPDSGGGEWFEITEVQAAAKHIQHNTMVLSKKYAADAVLLSMTKVKFYLDTTTDPDRPKLMLELPGRPPQVFAEDIEDLEFRYRMKNGMVLDEPVITDDIREVLISLTARSRGSDADLVEAQGDDGYRRREFTTAVFLRNVGI